MALPIPDLYIRRADGSDIPMLQELTSQSVWGLNARDYTPEQIASALQFIFGVDSQLIADGTYYVAVVDGEIVGSGGWSRHKALFGGDSAANRENDLLNPATDPAKIRAFYVHPAWSRRGIARQIMYACEGAALREGFKSLELMATLTGVPLYIKCGFHARVHTAITLPDGVMLPVVKMTKRIA